MIRPKGREGRSTSLSAPWGRRGNPNSRLVISSTPARLCMDHAVAATRDLPSAGCVFFLLLGVLATVELDRELAAGTGEIDDMRSDRMLPPKAVLARELAQSQPHRLLGFRRSPPQPPGNPGPPFQRQVMLPISLSAPQGRRGPG